MPCDTAIMCEKRSNRTISHNKCLDMTFLDRLAFKMYFFIFQVRIVKSAIGAKYKTHCSVLKALLVLYETLNGKSLCITII